MFQQKQGLMGRGACGRGVGILRGRAECPSEVTQLPKLWCVGRGWLQGSFLQSHHNSVCTVTVQLSLRFGGGGGANSTLVLNALHT